MALLAGTRLGPYEIETALGAGGMGEVYRARDTRLERTVAVKVVNSALVASADLKTRFEREAKTISQLNHPHICTLHDVGSQDGLDFLVMEYLEGETLSDRLRKGALKLDDVLKIGVDIADALDKAHRRGIVHRDLKPGNIMLTKAGAKLMDFGLAKPVVAASGAVAGSAPLLSAAMTMTSPSPQSSPLTSAGMLIGTVQYMSPEQLQGMEADARSDIFAFGAVLYEMITGRRAFDGKSQLSVATAILEKEIEPLASTIAGLPPALDHVVQRCLAKNPDERFQSALDLKFDLQWCATQTVAAPTHATSTGSLWRWAAPLALAMLVLFAALATWRYAGRDAHSPPVQAYLPPPEGAEFLTSDDDVAGPVVISSSASFLAFTAQTSDGKRAIWVQALRDAKPRPIPGTEGGSYPFWSPDEKWLGFFADGKLKKAPLNGGPALPLADAPRGRGGTWNQFGEILYAPTTQGGLFVVNANGGSTPHQVLKLDGPVHTTLRWPLWLPDGKTFLYLASNHSHPEASERNGIYVGSVNGKAPRMLMPSDSGVAVADGYLLSAVHGALMAQRFDADSATLKGESIAIGQSVLVNPGTWRGAFDLSQSDILVYQGGSTTANLAELLWRSPLKAEPVKVSNPDDYYQVRLSPDGKRAAVTVGDPHSVLTVLDVQRGTRTRLTFEGTADDSMAWSPDGKRIAYGQRNSGPLDMYIKDSSGSGSAELVYASEFDKEIWDWSPDGKYLLFASQESSNGPTKLFLLPLQGERKPQVFAQAPAPFVAFQGSFSPDGKWVAYTSSESGSNEIYVTNFPQSKGKWQVSVGGGTQARWMHDGKSILYLAADTHTIMQVPVSMRDEVPSLGVGHPYVNAQGIYLWHSGVSYDVALDGRILVSTRIGNDSHQITLMVNWKTALKN